MIVYISYLVRQEQLQQSDPVAISCPENERFILMTLETVIKVSISRFAIQTKLVFVWVWFFCSWWCCFKSFCIQTILDICLPKASTFISADYQTC